MLAFGVAYVALYVPMGALPSDAQARLEYHAANPTVWWAILSLSVLTDLLLVARLVMLKSSFGKGTACLGVATGVLGIVSVEGPFLVGALGGTIILASVLTTAWAFLVGHKLYRLGRR